MFRNSPFILGVLLIVGLTAWEFQMTDRLSGTNFSAEEKAKLLEKVPANIGDWHGDDKQTDPNVRKTAGAIGAVSRTYRNSRTGEVVDLWLIVGHARDISFHTPDICYPAAGFEALATENSSYPMVFGDDPAGVPFFTNTFRKVDVSGQHLVRVFWSWFNPNDKTNQGKVVWETPSNPRWHFGNTRALYKMYFTSMMRDAKETADASSCVRFAKEFLPEVDKALAEVYHAPTDVSGSDKPAAELAGAEPKAAAVTAAEKAGGTKQTAEKPAATGMESPAKTESTPAPTAKVGGAEPKATTSAPENDPLFETPKATK